MATKKEEPRAVQEYQRPAPASSTWTAVGNLAEAIQLAEIVAKSNGLPDIRNAGQALLKILAGAEMGFGPFASLVDVHIIEGKPAVGAHLKAAAIKRSDHYDYRVIELTRDSCSLEFSERSRATGKFEVVGRVSMTLAEAEESGLTKGKDGMKRNWRVSSDDMLFARCISKGYRRYCPDLTSGVLVYDPDELDSDENPHQAVVECAVRPPAPVPDEAPTAPANGSVSLSSPLLATQQSRILELAGQIGKSQEWLCSQATKRFGREVAAVSTLTALEAGKLIDGLEKMTEKTKGETR